MHSYRSRPRSPDSLTTGDWQSDESKPNWGIRCIKLSVSVALLPSVYLVRLYLHMDDSLQTAGLNSLGTTELKLSFRKTSKFDIKKNSHEGEFISHSGDLLQWLIILSVKLCSLFLVWTCLTFFQTLNFANRCLPTEMLNVSFLFPMWLLLEAVNKKKPSNWTKLTKFELFTTFALFPMKFFL